MLDIQYLDGLELALAALNKQVLGCRLPNDQLLLLSIDLATFCDIWSTRGLLLSLFGSLTSSCVFSLPLPWLPTSNQFLSTCGIDEKLSKMVVIQLATHCRVDELKYLWWLCNSGELCVCGIDSMHCWDIIHWIIKLSISKYLSLCVSGWFSKIWSYIHTYTHSYMVAKENTVNII